MDIIGDGRGIGRGWQWVRGGNEHGLDEQPKPPSEKEGEEMHEKVIYIHINNYVSSMPIIPHPSHL